MARPFGEARGRRDALAAAQLRATRASSRFGAGQARVQGDSATLTVDVTTEVGLAGVAGAPPITASVDGHVFTFVRRNGAWELVDDRIPNPFQLTGEHVGGPSPRVADPATSVDISARGQRGQRVRPNQTSFRRGSPGMFRLAGSGTAPTLGTYSAQQAEAYARRYWYPYNGSYRNFENTGTEGGDCTNFTSQVLRAGGWGDVGGWLDRTDATAWWYGSMTQTYTWVGAHKFYFFARDHSQGRASRATNVYYMLSGDILQADLNRDGYVDHSTVVTKTDSNGMPYLTYHTSPNLDVPFTEFQRRVIASYGTDAYYHGWFVWSTY
jgi:hypothetical protein